MQSLRACLLAALLLCGLATQAAAQATSPSATYTAMAPVITEAGAKFLLEQAIAAVDQYPQAVVVVDAGGNIKAQTRMDGVAPGVMSAAAVSRASPDTQ